MYYIFFCFLTLSIITNKMENEYTYFPKLIEPGTKYFLFESLKKCNVNKSKYYNTLFNFGLLLIFIFYFRNYINL